MHAHQFRASDARHAVTNPLTASHRNSMKAPSRSWSRARAARPTTATRSARRPKPTRRRRSECDCTHSGSSSRPRRYTCRTSPSSSTDTCAKSRTQTATFQFRTTWRAAKPEWFSETLKPFTTGTKSKRNGGPATLSTSPRTLTRLGFSFQLLPEVSAKKYTQSHRIRTVNQTMWSKAAYVCQILSKQATVWAHTFRAFWLLQRDSNEAQT